MAKTPDGFVSLKSLKQGPSSPRDTLALLRRIYFKTKKETIEHDFAHAIELLKSLETEEEREKATAYMHGLVGITEGMERPGRKFKVAKVKVKVGGSSSIIYRSRPSCVLSSEALRERCDSWTALSDPSR